MDNQTRAASASPAWWELCDRIKALKPSAVAIDPLQIFCSLDLNLPENAQFVCSHVSRLAAETNAAIIISHHFRKSDVSTPEEARAAIRGTAGLVDGVRSVYALWPMPEAPKGGGGARQALKALGIPFKSGRVIQGAIVKANGQASDRISTFVRDDSGLLVDETDRLRGVTGHPDDLKDLLALAVAEAAIRGMPYTKTGLNGLFSRRHELGDPFAFVSKHRLESMAQEMLDSKRLVLSLATGGKTVKWLDLPNGPFARGEGEFAPGHMGEKPVPGNPKTVPWNPKTVPWNPKTVPGSRFPVGTENREGSEPIEIKGEERSRFPASQKGREGRKPYSPKGFPVPGAVSYGEPFSGNGSVGDAETEPKIDPSDWEEF